MFVLLTTLRNMYCRNEGRGTRDGGRGTRDGGRNTFLHFLLLVSCFLYLASYSQNCGCDEKKLVFSQSYTNSHKLIFRGKTTVIANGEGFSKVTFIVTQLFKGNSTKEIDVYFDGKSACNLKFNTSEDWIIYANYKQLKKPFVEYCSRSRKNVVNSNKNIELTYIKSDLTVDEECEKLRGLTGLQKFSSQEKVEDLAHSNIIPGFWQRIVLILCSVGGFMLIYFAANKLMRK